MPTVGHLAEQLRWVYSTSKFLFQSRVQIHVNADTGRHWVWLKEVGFYHLLERPGLKSWLQFLPTPDACSPFSLCLSHFVLSLSLCVCVYILSHLSKLKRTERYKCIKNSNMKLCGFITVLGTVQGNQWQWHSAGFRSLCSECHDWNITALGILKWLMRRKESRLSKNFDLWSSSVWEPQVSGGVLRMMRAARGSNLSWNYADIRALSFFFLIMASVTLKMTVVLWLRMPVI